MRTAHTNGVALSYEVRGRKAMEKQDYFAVFGGFGLQCWTSPGRPDIFGKCDGLTVCRVNGSTGEMSVVSQSHGVESPSTLVIAPDNRHIYAANESHDFQGIGHGGGVTAFSFDPETGKTEVLNQSYSFGSSACYIALDKTGRYLLVANHGSRFYVTRFREEGGKLVPQVVRDEGCVSLLEILPDGRIGRLLDRLILEGTGGDAFVHGSAHPHSVQIDEDDFVIIPNKGGDNIYVAKLNRQTQKLDTLSVYKTAHGSSPRHVFFVPGTTYVLIQNEFDAHLCSYHLNRDNGELTAISCVDTIDREHVGNVTSIGGSVQLWGLDIQVHPNNRFVYTDNTVGTICLSYLNVQTGELTVQEQFPLDVQTMPRGIQINRDGTLLAVSGVQDEKVIVLHIDPKTGKLQHAYDIPAPTPTAVRFVYPK